MLPAYLDIRKLLSVEEQQNSTHTVPCELQPRCLFGSVEYVISSMSGRMSKSPLLITTSYIRSRLYLMARPHPYS